MNKFTYLTSFLVLFSSLAVCQLYTPARFSWTAGGDYAISGSFCSNSAFPNGTILYGSCNTATIVINPSMNRSAVLFGTTGGDFYHFSDRTYVSNLHPVLCGVSFNYTTFTFWNDYSLAQSIDQKKDSFFFGNVPGTCGTDVATFFDVDKNGRIMQWSFGQRFTIFQGLCSRVWGDIVLDKHTLVTNDANNFNNYFNFPAACENPQTAIPYCPSFYFFPGNACF